MGKDTKGKSKGKTRAKNVWGGKSVAEKQDVKESTDSLRWPNMVFAHAFADAIQRVHKDCKKQTCRQ